MGYRRLKNVSYTFTCFLPHFGGELRAIGHHQVLKTVGARPCQLLIVYNRTKEFRECPKQGHLPYKVANCCRLIKIKYFGKKSNAQSFLTLYISTLTRSYFIFKRELWIKHKYNKRKKITIIIIIIIIIITITMKNWSTELTSSGEHG